LGEGDFGKMVRREAVWWATRVERRGRGGLETGTYGARVGMVFGVGLVVVGDSAREFRVVLR
jgi:hypothetical protein